MTLSNHAASPRSGLAQASAYLLFALVSLLIVAIHTDHFHGRNYRQDEAWRVHLALVSDIPQTVDWAARNIHPPLWQIGLDVWVSAFGDLESITRLFSTLWTLLALATTFRLGSDLFGYRVGLLGVFILGSLAFFQFYMHETRPYAQLVFFTTLTQLAFLRWLRQPTARHAFIFVVAGIATAYTHFFGLIFIATLALYFILFVRFQPGIYVRAFGLFAAIGLAFTGWLLPFLHSFLVVRPGGIDYALAPEGSSLWHNLDFLESQMMIRPTALGEFLLILGLVTSFALPATIATNDRFRFGHHWRRLYLLIIPLTLLLLAFAANSVISSLTPRNLLIILPSLALIVGLGISVLPSRAQIVILVLILLPFVNNFRSYVANGPYQEIISFMSPDYQPGDPVVMDAAFMWQHIAMGYYVQERMPVQVPNGDIIHLLPVADPASILKMPVPAVNVFPEVNIDNMNQFNSLVQDKPQIWYIEIEDGNAFSRAYLETIERDYIAVNQADWGIENRRYTPHVVTQYRRVPDNLQTLVNFGEDIHLQEWDLLDNVTVQACQSVTLESWWEVQTPPQENYSLTLVLASNEGTGIARSDGTPAGLLMQQWQPNRPYLDRRQLTIPCDASPGDYNLLIGLYNFETGATLGELTYLTTLTIP